MRTAFRYISIYCLLYSACFLSCHRRWHVAPEIEFHVRVSVSGGGSVSVAPADSIFSEGARVILSASAASGSVFAGWHGDLRSLSNPCTLYVTRDYAIEARFVLIPHGMVKISAAGAVFSMGSAGPQAQTDIESPVHQVIFTYDFFIDPREVTQKQFMDVMGFNPAGGKGYADEGDSFPVFELTWYDAALYCNARSKNEGYDTVYTYTAVCTTGQVCPYVLENLSIHYDRFGYRLPTEAEWEYACRAGTSTEFFWGQSDANVNDYAWYFDNSSGTCHPVGRKLPNAFGLFDMAGNVAEWVNDWMETYADTPIVNPIGPTGKPLEIYESSYERPVRGGSYRLSAQYLRPAGRRLGPYETSAQAVVRDIGFRTVLGAFFPAGGIAGGKDSLADTSGLVIRCRKSDLISAIGTSNVKLVFVRQTGQSRHLYCVDFLIPDPSPFLLDDPLPVCNPVISPDGRYVAYSSKGEGFSGPSVMTVRPLDGSPEEALRTQSNEAAYCPRWWVDTTSGDTCIIYTDGASMNNTAQWYAEKTYRRKISGLTFTSAPEVLWPRGSYHGGLSTDGRFLATGYPTARLVDLLFDDTTYLYFRAPYNGRDDNPQTCNVSINPGKKRTDEVLLLDFGYGKTSTVVGRPYGLHEIIFKCNSKIFTDEHVTAWYAAPPEYRSWNHVEYTNHPDFAAAVAFPPREDSPETIFLIDMMHGAYTPLLSGKGLRDVWLWIDPSQVAEFPDPYADFALYDLPYENNTQFILGQKLKLLWKRRQAVECVFLGSSEAYWGVEPSSMQHFTCLNAAAKGSFMETNAYLALHYALTLASEVKAVCLSLDPGLIDQTHDIEQGKLSGLYYSKGFQLDSANNFWRSGVPPSIAAKAAAFDSKSWIGCDSSGAPDEKRQARGWGAVIFDQGDYSFFDTIVQKNLAQIEALADSAAAKNIHVLVVNMPVHPGYRDTTLVGRYGPSRTTFAQIDAWLRSLEARNQYFHYYDANAGGNHDYSGSEAYDCNHLSYTGAVKLSGRIDSVLHNIISTVP